MIVFNVLQWIYRLALRIDFKSANFYAGSTIISYSRDVISLYATFPGLGTPTCCASNSLVMMDIDSEIYKVVLSVALTVNSIDLERELSRHL